MAEMTTEVIVASCKANGGYASPHLNDQLFLHCKGFTRIQNLEPYKDIKVLWLEQNALSDLSGLEQQTDTLVSLFLQNNFIRSLTSLTAVLHGLRVLNVSHNYLTSLRGIANACPSLETLQASHNQLTSLQVCEELWRLAGSLTSVDLSFNRIESVLEPLEGAVAGTASEVAAAEGNCTDADDIRIVDVPEVSGIVSAPVNKGAAQPPSRLDPLSIVQFFQHLPLVSVIYLQGNGLSQRVRQYRRNMILHLPALTYLDERPVFPEERRVTEAWGRGGETAEAAERAAVREEKRAHLTQCVSVLTEQREAQRVVRDRLTQQFDQRRAQELEELMQRRRLDRDNRAAVGRAETAARDGIEKAEQNDRWDVEELFQETQKALLATEPAHRHAYEQHMAVSRAAYQTAQETFAHRGTSGDAGSDDESSSTVTSVAAAAALQIIEDAATQSHDSFFSAHVPNEAACDAAMDPKAPPAHSLASTAVAALLQSDEDILREMEMEMERVLFDTGSSAAPERAVGGARDAEHRDAAPFGRQMVDRTMLRLEKNVHAAVHQASEQLRRQQEQQMPQRRSSDTQRKKVWQRFEQWEARRASQQLNQ